MTAFIKLILGGSLVWGLEPLTTQRGQMQELTKQLCLPSNYESKFDGESVVFDICLSDEWLLINAPLSWAQAHAQDPKLVISLNLTDQSGPPEQYGAYGQISFYDFAVLTRTSHKQCPASVLSLIGDKLTDGAPTNDRRVTETGFCFNGASLYIQVPKSSVWWQADSSAHTWALSMWDVSRVVGSAVERLPHQVSLFNYIR